MRDIPIIFSAPMIRALLDGRKTQTRRILKPQPELLNPRGWRWDAKRGSFRGAMGTDIETFPETAVAHAPYAVGDRLWVRENFSRHLYDDGCWYWADGNVADLDSERIRPSIHMPRWASRLTLVVEQVRVERLQDISEADAKAEGCPAQTDEELAGMEARGWFRDLWDSINGPGAWDANPWVVALTFSVIRSNIDAIPSQEAA